MKTTQQAFTIIELLITVTIMVVLIATAVPTFRSIIANNRSTSLAGEMLTALNVARSEAVKRGHLVSVCPSASGAVCTATAWQDGWIVFADNATSDTATPPIVGRVIKQWGANPPGAVVDVNRGAAAAAFVRFNAQGLLARPLSSTDTVIIDIRQDGCQGNSARQLEVGIAGRVNQISMACP